MTVSQQPGQGFEEFRPRKNNTGKYILVGCLSFVIAGLLLVSIGGIVVWQNLRGWTANASIATADRLLQEIHLPNEEHDAIMQRARLLAEEFKDKNITVAEFQQLGEALTESELMPMLIAKAMYGGYIAPSTLSDEDKARGQLAFGRLARGVVDEKLVEDDFDYVVSPLSKNAQYSIGLDSDSDSDISLRSPRQVSNEDLLLVIERAEKLAEEKELSPEPLNVDIVEELDRIVEETLGRKIVPPGKD